MKSKFTLLWFFFGLGAKLQILASLSISELLIILMTPLVIFNEVKYMRQSGVNVLFWLSLSLIIGCVMSCAYNNTYTQFALRGVAITVVIFCAVVVWNYMLRSDMNGLKWYFLGLAISGVLCTFIFQRAGDIELYAKGNEGVGAVEELMSSPLFWIERLGAWLYLPLRGWYLAIPKVVALFIPLFLAIFSMITSVSGRAAALGAIGCFVIIFIGGKKRYSMSFISRHFWVMCVCGFLLCLIVHSIYSFSANAGYLGEDAQKKYEYQSQGEKSIGRLILGGRSEAFIGLLACRDQPIFGFGPWALDNKGYTQEFIERFGTFDDVEKLRRINEIAYRKGLPQRLIQFHSHITQFWLWFGIAGLVFWIYVVYVFIRFLRQDLAVVPQWFFWLAGGMPAMLWGIIFSPCTDRIGIPLFIVACLFARAIRRGRIIMPLEMQIEIIKSERK